MNVWQVAATILLVAVAPCGIVLLRASLLDALIALELIATLVAVVLVLIAEGQHRSSYFVVPVVLAFLNLVGGLIFVRFLAGRRV